MTATKNTIEALKEIVARLEKNGGFMSDEAIEKVKSALDGCIDSNSPGEMMDHVKPLAGYMVCGVGNDISPLVGELHEAMLSTPIPEPKMAFNSNSDVDEFGNWI